jgi:hypothetical protein
MGTVYSRIIKPGPASDFNVIMRIGNEVRRVLSGIVGLGTDSDEFVEEVRVQMQPTPDNGLAIIGWIGRDAATGIPDHNYDLEVEFIPPVYSKEEQEVIDRGTGEASSASEPPPFPIS